MLINILFSPCQIFNSCILKAKLKKEIHNQVKFFYLQRSQCFGDFCKIPQQNRLHLVPKMSKGMRTETRYVPLKSFVVKYKSFQVEGKLEKPRISLFIKTVQVSPALLVPALLS